MSDTNFQEELAQYLSKLRGLVPVGTLWWGFDAKAKPFGVQLYQGQYLSRELYKVHFEYVLKHRTIVTNEEWEAYADSHNGMCPYFSYGDNSSTYRMPRINNVHPKFSDSYIGVGDYIPAGLPNITATWTWMTTESAANWATYPCLGAAGFNSVSYTKGLDSAKYVSSKTAGRDMSFDASSSNSIYGSSNTVQPPAINMIVGEYVVSALGEFSVTTSEMLHERMDELEENVVNVVNVENFRSELKKYNTSYVVESYRSDTEWYRIYSDGFIEQGGNIILSATEETILTFHKPFTNTNYQIFFGDTSAGQTGLNYGGAINRTTSNTTCYINSGSGVMFWYAIGY